ncbi:Glutamyl/glutaminyl-tRNA synthetase, class Ib, catalytic domain protein [Kalmanozyma brasiliensis GHG001]|uniref:Glutamate--tRNA ligase, mitochondrial n=1 Tax=Kalmanozyma brasiliensis (strain GHG001) TaxID=1365824 RepID=V5GIX4_KALBG|nr:Glutamyl/glutaminyl-tRNA synthetase, class Ib, catalytic domain protein [Kalmanozyma brasiliensis GHG001]EST05932.1 Glutamyl/glutaminyl-tRNA synthetase, class Ib, catalytic domain protein [Kalmanozyma brasiliensis GHG001]
MSASRLSSGGRKLITPLRRRLYSTSSPAGSSSSSAPARLRFAPSPTGYLHLGGLRTALFNHLYARALGGKWILRIEDTDQTRLVPGSVAALQETLEWAKLDYDEGPSTGGSYGPYVQSERLDLYRAYAEKLVSEGKAYRDFRAEVVAPGTDVSRTKHMPLRDNYIPPSESEAKHLISLNKPCVVRLKAPSGALDHHDLVYGDVHFPADPQRHGTEDPILLKSNGWPTYHLANVVDDHEMGITHVLRGEEWLPSLPKHLWLYRALGLQEPKFAHLPLLVNADGTKLSKRTGDVRVESYREKGVEPEALCNFLGLMGYNNLAYHQSADGGKEGRVEGEKDETGYDVLTMQEMIRGFDISHVNRSRATVDLPKLYYLNARHLALKLEDTRTGGGRDDLVAKVTPKLVEAFPDLAKKFETDPGFVESVIVLTKGTSATLYDVPESAHSLFRRPDFTSSEAQELFTRSSLINTHFADAVRQAYEQYSTLEEWSREAIHRVIADLPKLLSDAQPPKDVGGGAKTKVKKAAVLAPLRFAISARERGAPLADLFLFLGKEESVQRLNAALEACEQGTLRAA